MPGDPNDPIAFVPPGRAEAAQLLGITWEAAKRCSRAGERLEDALATMPGGCEGF